MKQVVFKKARRFDTCESNLACESELERQHGHGYLYSGYWKGGDQVTCPSCGTVYEHECDEAEGCAWWPR